MIYFIAHGVSKQSRIHFIPIARTFDVEIKDLFEFAHLQADGGKAEEREKLLEGGDEEKKRTIMKIVRAVVR